MREKDTINEVLAGFIWAVLSCAGNIAGLLASAGNSGSLLLAAMLDLGLIVVLSSRGKATEATGVGIGSGLALLLGLLFLSMLPAR